jgi:hypothetical protein
MKRLANLVRSANSYQRAGARIFWARRGLEPVTGKSSREITRTFNVSRNTVRRCLRVEGWRATGTGHDLKGFGARA